MFAPNLKKRSNWPRTVRRWISEPQDLTQRTLDAIEIALGVEPVDLSIVSRALSVREILPIEVSDRDLVIWKIIELAILDGLPQEIPLDTPIAALDLIGDHLVLKRASKREKQIERIENAALAIMAAHPLDTTRAISLIAKADELARRRTSPQAETIATVLDRGSKFVEQNQTP